MTSLKNMPTFGVAGNFTGHLEQAGEARDFVGIKTKEANEPKAIFPTYIPSLDSKVPSYLKVFPFDENKIIFPQGESKLQIEPECAIICNVEWNGDTIKSLQPIAFAASNDCSIRKEGAKKISEKKNWGASSKGLSCNLIDIDRFEAGGILDRYRIASFLIRDNNIYDYGEDSAVKDYSYIYKKLLNWAVDKFNLQKEEGPAECINEYLKVCTHKNNLMLSIGATRYTSFGQNNFLQNNDVSCVVLYPQDKYSAEDIKTLVLKKDITEYPSDISILKQKVELLA